MNADHTPRTPVDSEQMKSVGHDPSRNVLHIEFRPTKGQSSGQVYAYENVPKSVYDALMEAESKGGFFAKHIRAHPKAHPFRKI